MTTWRAGATSRTQRKRRRSSGTLLSLTDSEEWEGCPRPDEPSRSSGSISSASPSNGHPWRRGRLMADELQWLHEETCERRLLHRPCGRSGRHRTIGGGRAATTEWGRRAAEGW
jgi:hypothetical protein